MCVFHPRDVEVGGLVKVCWIFFLLPYICGRKWSQLCTYYKETTGYYIQLRYAAIWLYRGLLEHTGMLLESWIRNLWGILVAKSKRTVYAQQNTVERSFKSCLKDLLQPKKSVLCAKTNMTHFYTDSFCWSIRRDLRAYIVDSGR